MPSSSNSDSEISSKSKDQLVGDIQEGARVLHLACLTSDAVMVELLIQCGADVNAIDSRGCTPLHYCIMRGNNASAKVLISR